MGYQQYWSRPPTLDPKKFKAWSNDVRKVVFSLPHEMIRGPSGEGEPIITPTLIALNGNRDTYVWRDYWIRNSDLSLTDAHMPFTVEQSLLDSSRSWVRQRSDDRGWLRDDCKTQQKPYDIAVTAALILLVHHFPQECRVWSDGGLADWREGLMYAERATGLSLVIPTYSHLLHTSLALPLDAFAAWSSDVARVLAIVDVPLAGPDGTGEPIATPTLVAFNGVGDDGYDPFYLPCGSAPEWRDDHKYDWVVDRFPPALFLKCLTMGNAGKPYDNVVTAAMLLFLLHFPDMTDVFSDGDTQAWQRGRNLVCETTGITFDVSVDDNKQVVISL